MSGIFKNRLHSKESIQYIFYSGSNVLLMLLGFATTLLVTKQVNGEVYGEYRYIVDLSLTIMQFTMLGIPYSISRIIAKKEYAKSFSSSMYLFTVIYSLFISLLSVIVISLVNFLDIKNMNVLIYSFIIFGLSLMDFVIKSVLKGNNEIGDLSIFILFKQILMFLIIILLPYIGITIDLNKLLIINIFSMIVPHIFIFVKNGITTKEFKSNLKELLEENRYNGFQIYIGSLATVGITRLVSVVIGGISSMSSYGLYSLGLTFSSPLSLIISSFATVRYKANVSRERIESKEIMNIIVLSFISMIFFWFFIKWFIIFVYDNSYQDVIVFARWLMFSSVLTGFGDYINEFIMAKGLGKNLRNIQIITSIIGLIIVRLTYDYAGIWTLVIYGYCTSVLYVTSRLITYLNFRRQLNTYNMKERV